MSLTESDRPSPSPSPSPSPLPPSNWKFFAGACLLTAALVVPQAGMTPALEGMGLAALILTLWTWLGPSR